LFPFLFSLFHFATQHYACTRTLYVRQVRICIRGVDGPRQSDSAGYLTFSLLPFYRPRSFYFWFFFTLASGPPMFSLSFLSFLLTDSHGAFHSDFLPSSFHVTFFSFYFTHLCHNDIFTYIHPFFLILAFGCDVLTLNRFLLLRFFSLSFQVITSTLLRRERRFWPGKFEFEFISGVEE